MPSANVFFGKCMLKSDFIYIKYKESREEISETELFFGKRFKGQTFMAVF